MSDEYTIDDVLKLLDDHGMTGLTDVVQDLKLEHGAARAENERLLAFRADEDARARSLESKARVADELLREDGDFAVVSKKDGRVLTRDEINTMLEARREPAEQRAEQQPRSLLGGGGLE